MLLQRRKRRDVVAVLNVLVLYMFDTNTNKKNRKDFKVNVIDVMGVDSVHLEH